MQPVGRAEGEIPDYVNKVTLLEEVPSALVLRQSSRALRAGTSSTAVEAFSPSA